MIHRTVPSVAWLFVLTSALAGCSDSGGSSSATSAVATAGSVPSTTALPVTTGISAPTTTLAPPMIYRWSTPDPMAVGLQFSGGGPPSLIVASEGGHSVEIHGVGIPAGSVGSGSDWSWDRAAELFPMRAAPVEIDGTPIVIESLHFDTMATVAVTTMGGLAEIGLGPEFAEIPHPGRVTDVAMKLGSQRPQVASSGELARPTTGLWAAGYDGPDGQQVPTVWQTTGLWALDGEIAGVASTTVVATGSTGATGPVLVGVDNGYQLNAARVFALLPDPDGSSRLWIVQDDDHGTPGPTELRFRDPTTIEVTGDAVWIGDADGLHRVGLAEPKLLSTTLWETPVRRLVRLDSSSGSNRPPFEVIVLDADGCVIRTAGEPPEVVWEDRAATDLTTVLDQLVILHRAENEVMVLDPNLLA